MAACVGFRCLWKALSMSMQASEPNKPRHINGITTPVCQADSNTLKSRDAIKAKLPAPITNTANEVEVTAMGLSCCVILSV